MIGMRHGTTLVMLIGAAVGAAGWMQGIHWKRTAKAEAADPVELAALQQKVDALEAENEKLRSLTQGGGEFSIPPEAVTRVESHTGLSFRSTPVVHQIAEEELRDRILASLENRFGPGGLDDRNMAYQYIGWLGVEDKLGGQLAAMRAVGARTWFDEMSGEGWVTDRYTEENVPDQASLLKVLTRILLHQHYPPQEVVSDDAMRTRDALHNGVAAGVEAKYFQDNVRAIGFMSVKEDTDAQQLLFALPPFLQGLGSFASMEGKTYADTLLVKGREELYKALHRPPQRSGDLLFPYERKLRAAAAVLPETPGEIVLEDSGGALGVKLWLDPLGDVLQSRNMAEKLCDDRWRLFATDDLTHHAVWVSEWSDEAAAGKALAAFLAMGGALAGSDDDLTLGNAVKTPEGRLLRIDQPSPTTLRLTNAADQKTLDAVR